MIINFAKMHSLGNSFVIINAITKDVKMYSQVCKNIANPKVGIGCDQIILIEPPLQPLSDFYYKIYNADGSVASQCLNGARCAAKFCLDFNLIKHHNMIAECDAGKINLKVKDDLVSAALNIFVPELQRHKVMLPSLNVTVELYRLSVGNPHLICLINAGHNITIGLPQDLRDPLYQAIYANIQQQPDLYGNGINLGFAKIISREHMSLRVFERGCGETLACGSNALAAFIVAHEGKLVDVAVKIDFTLGSLDLYIIDHYFKLKGPVNHIFSGKLKI